MEWRPAGGFGTAAQQEGRTFSRERERAVQAEAQEENERSAGRGGRTKQEEELAA